MTVMADTAIPAFNLQDEFVRAINKESHPVYFTWHAKDYRVDALGEGFIPFQAMATRYGHPMSALEEYKHPQYGTIPARSYERRRLEGQWGNSTEYAKEHGLSTMEAVQALAYKVEFYQLDGTRLNTVVDDPEGKEGIVNYNEGTPNDPRTLQQMIIHQKRQIAYLEQAMESITEGRMVTDNSVPEDDPDVALDTPLRARGMRGGIQSTPPPPPPVGDGDDDNPMMVGSR
jgi:hypothetical protein